MKFREDQPLIVPDLLWTFSSQYALTKRRVDHVVFCSPKYVEMCRYTVSNLTNKSIAIRDML